MRVAISMGTLALGLSLSGAAAAEGMGTVQLALALTANVAYDDDFEFKQSGVKQKGRFADDSDDVEKNFGLFATYEFPVTSSITAGPRLGFITGETDDSEFTLRALDAGATSRVFFNDGNWRGFASLSAGLTYGMVKDGEIGLVELDADLSGIGYHVVAGVGVQGKIDAPVGLMGGVYYSHHALPEVSGDANNVTDVVFSDIVVSRILLTAGITF
jgi:hypothetical protein